MKDHDEWKLLRSFVVIVFVAIVLGMTMDDTATASDTHRGETAQQWYEQYMDQKQKSQAQYKRIKVLNGRNRSMRLVLTRRSQLSLMIVPWVRLATCESGRRWGYGPHVKDWSGFYGGVQFTASTWKAYGGHTFARQAHRATPIQQIAIAQKVLRSQGRGAWPGCTAKGAW